jgi:hypothetical protein
MILFSAQHCLETATILLFKLDSMLCWSGLILSLSPALPLLGHQSEAGSP